jgi:hypothetical protein
MDTRKIIRLDIKRMLDGVKGSWKVANYPSFHLYIFAFNPYHRVNKAT